MKRILLSIALPLAIVAVAWQLAPAEVEVPAAAVGEVAAADGIPVVGEFAVAVTDVDAAGDAASRATRRDGKVDYKRLLAQNPDLVKVLIDSSGEGSGEYGKVVHVALISMDGAAVPHLLKILNETEDASKKQFVGSLLATAAVFPNYPIEDVVPSLLKLAKSDDEDEKELGIVFLAQVLHFQGLPEVQRVALRLEFQTDSF